MRNLSATMQARLHSDATSLCHCWKLMRRDGAIAGFTDHDRTIEIAGLSYVASTGLDGRSAEASLGLAVSGTEVTGALHDESLLETDLLNGLYDGATLETWLVDWSQPEHRMLLDVSTIGEVKRSEFAFTAELRGLAQKLDQEIGRRYQQSCSADLGDARCGLTLDARYSETVSLLAASTRTDLVFGLVDRPDDWFTGGVVQSLDGANAGARATIRSQRMTTEGMTLLTLWTPFAAPPAPGDMVRLTPGCDKSLATCAQKFANVANFRGFPHMPGNDHLLSYPAAGDPPMDGGSLFS